MEDWHKGGSHYNNKVNQSRITNLLGHQMLMARRLVERGCGFVTVVDCTWDFHNDGNNPATIEGMNVLGPQADQQSPRSWMTSRSGPARQGAVAGDRRDGPLAEETG
ncbi:MAG: hypothetical protein CM1200mP2_16350 [Planctomycetaceae bacterium]|nr:MAG: hypothetical protein CM1200mP2_16350 [Planctomycetaceae bacterium]